MAENVISHHKPRRKRGSAWAWTTRRLLALALTVAAIAAATWVIPYLRPVAPRFPDAQLPSAAITPELPEPVAVGELAGPPAPQGRADRRAHGVPLDADARGPGEDFEVLSAAELAGISQARD